MAATYLSSKASGIMSIGDASQDDLQVKMTCFPEWMICQHCLWHAIKIERQHFYLDVEMWPLDFSEDILNE